MTYSCIFCTVGLYGVPIFFSAFNTLSYEDVSVYACFVRCLKSGDFSEISFGLTPYLSSDITQTYIFSSSSDVGIMSSSIPCTKYSLCALQNILRVSAGWIILKSAYLTSLVITTLLVSGLYKLYLSLVWLSTYHTIIALNVLPVIWFLNLSCLVTYPIHPNSENKEMIFGFSP